LPAGVSSFFIFVVFLLSGFFVFVFVIKVVAVAQLSSCPASPFLSLKLSLLLSFQVAKLPSFSVFAVKVVAFTKLPSF